MDLIEEQDRAAIAHLPVLFRFGHSSANVLDASHNGGQRNEV